MEFGFDEAEKQFNKMVDKYRTPSSLWFEEVEAELRIDGRELTRQILQAHINSKGLGDVGPNLVTTDGVVLTHRRTIKKSLQTMFGKVVIERIGYSQPNHPSLFPLDAVLNLPTSSFSAGLQRFIVRRASMLSFEEVIEMTQEITGVKIAKPQTLEIVQRCATDFESFYQSKQNEKGQYCPILVLTTDGKGIVMRSDGLRDETRNRAMKASSKMKKRLAPGEKPNQKRMAQVASIYFIKRFVRTTDEIIDEFAHRKASSRRPRPVKKRVWASVESDTDEVIKSLFIEAHKRDPKHRKEWVVLVDGNQHQFRLVRSLSRKEGIEPIVILDIIHVIEYLWKAARLFNSEKDHIGCERWVEEKLEKVLNGQAGRVAGSIRMLAAKRTLTTSGAKTAKTCAGYIANHKIYMNYAEYLKRGYPIATGVIEGACRYLIKDRMDITGARWGLDGAESVLKLRSLVTSGDFDDYWKFYRRQEYERNHSSKFADLDKLHVLQPS